MKNLMRPAIVIPIAIWLIARIAGHFISIEAQCHGGWTPECWSRWDSGLYLQIATQGHNLTPCEDWPGAWCGNAGWAPLYPMLMRMFGNLGMNMAQSGLWISQLCFWGLLLVCAKLWEINDFSLRSWLGVALVGFAPGSIYFQALFPVSMAAMLLALVHYFIKKESWWLAGLCGFFAVLTYSSGFFLLMGFGFYGLFRWMKEKKFPWEFALKVGIPPVLGLLVWFGYDYLSTGHWDAMFLIQQKYGHGLHSPIKHFGQHLRILFGHSWGMKSWVEVQNLVLMILVLFSAYWAFRHKNSPFSRFQGWYMFIFWMVPYSVGMDVSLYRGCALLTPGYSLFKNLPIAAMLVMLAFFLIMWFPMAVLFIQSITI